LGSLAGGKNFDESFYDAYGYSVVQFERIWRDGLSTKYNWVVVVTGSGALWGFITMLCVAAYFSVKRQRKKRLEEMEEEEKPIEQLISTIEQMEEKAPSALARKKQINYEKEPPSKIEVDGDFHTLH